MNNQNSVLIEGNLVRDPELTYIGNGTAVCKFAIANNRGKKVNDEWQNDTALSIAADRGGGEIYEAIRSRSSDGHWCQSEHDIIYNTSDLCGKSNCPDYEPRNRKKGICKHLFWCLVETGRKWKLYPDGRYEKIASRNKPLSR